MLNRHPKHSALRDDLKQNGFLPSLIEDPFFSELFSPNFQSSKAYPWPAVDIREYKDRYVLTADIPGVDEKDIKVELCEGNLALEAMHNGNNQKEEECRILVNERSRANFRRTFPLGEGIQADSITADYMNGILTVSIPKAEKVLPRVIPIKSRQTPSVN